MEAVKVNEHGEKDVLEVAEVPRPTPENEELLVEVAAAGVNPVDTYFVSGAYTPVELPFTPGVDIAGEVTEIGSDVDGFTPGDRILGTGIGNAEYQGAYAEYATIPTDRVVTVPDGVDLTEAGAAGVVAGTAWRALIGHAGLDPAECCLIHGGSGGVGHAAVQIADAVSARSITTAAPNYQEAVAELGADTVLDYGRDDLSEAIRETAGEGVNVILDHRMDDYLQFDGDVAAEGARVIGIGENAQDPSFTSVGRPRSKDVSYQLMSLFNTPDLRVPLKGVAHLMGEDRLSVEVARRYTVDEAAEAHRAVMEDSFFGKLVIVP